jgi:hypothetical protein
MQLGPAGSSSSGDTASDTRPLREAELVETERFLYDKWKPAAPVTLDDDNVDGNAPAAGSSTAATTSSTTTNKTHKPTKKKEEGIKFN